MNERESASRAKIGEVKGETGERATTGLKFAPFIWRVATWHFLHFFEPQPCHLCNGISPLDGGRWLNYSIEVKWGESHWNNFFSLQLNKSSESCCLRTWTSIYFLSISFANRWRRQGDLQHGSHQVRGGIRGRGVPRLQRRPWWRRRLRGDHIPPQLCPPRGSHGQGQFVKRPSKIILPHT